MTVGRGLPDDRLGLNLQKCTAKDYCKCKINGYCSIKKEFSLTLPYKIQLHTYTTNTYGPDHHWHYGKKGNEVSILLLNGPKNIFLQQGLITFLIFSMMYIICLDDQGLSKLDTD